VDPLRILLVDDSSAQRHIIRRRLENEAGVEVVGEAGGGREALYQFAALKPDVVLLDLVMPDMGGEEVLQALLEMDPSARVVVVSSLGTRDVVERCLRAGALSFLQKPFETEDMMRTFTALAVH
jgi:two-component system chemotaxis response regulator CheY